MGHAWNDDGRVGSTNELLTFLSEDVLQKAAAIAAAPVLLFFFP